MDILHITQIRADGGTQARASLDQPTVAEYKDIIERRENPNSFPRRENPNSFPRRENPNSFPFPAIIVFYDGDNYWLADGFHRLEAARLAGLQTVTADVRQGTQRDAILYAVGANADHGLRRTPEDKLRAVLRLLEDSEWGRWSDREIARRCKVSPTFVGKVRAENGVTVHVDSERTYTTKQGTTAVMNTEKIGKGDAPAAVGAVPVIYQPVWALQMKVGDWLRTEYGGETAAATAVLLELKASGDKHSRWPDVVAALPTPNRKGDIMQAINNVVDIWRARGAVLTKISQIPTLAEIQALARQLRPGDKVRIVMGGWAGDVAEVMEAREHPPVAWVQCLKPVTLPGGGIEERMVSHQFPIAWMELVEASPQEEQGETANDLPSPRLAYETMSAYEWLRDYKDDDGRTWSDLSDNQVHHANSPCYQEFVKQFPNVSDHKFTLKQCLVQLRQETAVPDMPEETPTPSPDDLKILLRRALHSFQGAAERWEERRARGLDDGELKEAIREEFGIHGSSSGPGMIPIAYKGGADPAFYYFAYAPGDKPTLRGRPLLEAVREAMQIPAPSATAASIAAIDVELDADYGRVLDEPEPAAPPTAALSDADAYLLTAVRPVALALPKLSSRQRNQAADYLKNMSSDEPAEIAALFRSLSTFVRDWRNEA